MKIKKSKYLIALISIVITLLAIFLALVLWQYTQEQKVEGGLVEGESKELDIAKKYVEDMLEDNKIAPNLVAIPNDIAVPDINSDLEDIKEELMDPIVLITFLNKYFDLNKESKYTAQDIYEFFDNKVGNALDVAVFSARILYPKASTAGIIRYDYLSEKNEENSHFVTIFRDSQSPKYLVTNELGQVEIYTYGRSFLDLIRNEEKRLNVKVTRYAHFSRYNSDLSEVISPFTWQYID